ncbi:hypothetical protein Taro_056407 [Colocasia esculenta]|uniref:Uncharacterized protein n=1 Tax=Colocasia esculenta TaxID=4460 RepID=A0A843XW39_COLES|nr:hypothetical protein [Colocasia esculenta]
MKNLSAHIDEEMSKLKKEFKVLNRHGTNIYCKGGVDTPHTGVDTMFQALRQKVKKWSTSVDTRPGQVDTRDKSQRNMLTGFYLRSTLNQMVDTKCWQVDTRWLSQKACFAVWDMVSTLDHLRSTLETFPRELICQSGTVCRHTSWAGRHTPESL